MSGYDPLNLTEWARIRHYTMPARMIAECAEARERGDWRAACDAGAVDVTFDDEAARPVAALLAGLAPDLLRWHLPRMLGGNAALFTDCAGYVIAPDGPLRPDTPVLLVRPPVSTIGSQRLTLEVGELADLDDDEAWYFLAPWQWDARRAGELRAAVSGSAAVNGSVSGSAAVNGPADGSAAVDGSAGRLPRFTPDGEPLPVEQFGRGDDAPARAERHLLAPGAPETWAEAGVDLLAAPEFQQRLDILRIDPARLASDVRRLGLPAAVVRIGWSSYLSVELSGERIRATASQPGWNERKQFDGMAPLLPAALQPSPDLDLIWHGRMPVDALHPLVREALFPGHSSAAASTAARNTETSVSGGDSGAVARSGAFDSSGVSVTLRAAAAFRSGGRSAKRSAADEPIRVRCRDGQWHEVAVDRGSLVLASHTPAEQQRERAMRAFGGAVTGCFAAAQAWNGASGRLPRRLRDHRQDLWLRIQHGGDRELFALLDAGLNPHLRDSRGRTLMHMLRSFDHARLLPRLLEAGVDVNATDREGNTPLHYAVLEVWPAAVIIALADAGADLHARDQDNRTVISYMDAILKYFGQSDTKRGPVFRAALQYVKERA
ncbi:ankyrin repeat domain-containing protein [Actinoplanes sp. NBRC 101535]|uniref:ankyrin repeat domain-containing protein n=1 Tax=Actinoplanes sp. NBRC 101535 TaxID=3032196 RepID=UPI0024A1CFD5|nr:ankyrin repeat domain-containing protein [Actinoplanes sp. NBRC 101535]GLY07048.1 hypothetical protein Acsp01_74270 [Actinoplanes sp. NBRC 101535]